MTSSDESRGAAAMESTQSTAELREVASVASSEDTRPRIDESAHLAQHRHRRAAVGFVAIGLLAATGGVAFPDAREVLFSLAAMGLFGSVLVTILGADQLVQNAVAEHVYDSTAKNEAMFVDALNLSERRIYVPTDEGVLLYVPANDDQPIPTDPTAPQSVDGKSNLVLKPTGSGLFREVHRTLPNDLEPGIETTARGLTEGLVEVLEIAREAVASADPVDGVVTVSVSGNSFGPVDRFDHPVASYLAVGFAMTLDRPVTLTVRPDDERSEWLITCSWNPDK